MKNTIISIVAMVCFSSLNAQTSDNLQTYVSYNSVSSLRSNSLLHNSYSESAIDNNSDENGTTGSKKEVPVKTERRRVKIGNFAPEVSESEIAYAPVTMIENKESSVNSVSDKSTNVTKAVDMNSNNNFHVTYSLLNEGAIKYSCHIEGRVKDCYSNGKIPHAYISVNSAIVKDKYEIIPTNVDGKFSIDITDDSIGSITVIKKGYEDKEIALSNNGVNENTSFGFEVCMEKTDDGGNNILAATESVSKAGQIYFDFNKASLKKETTDMLDKMINNIKATTTKSTTIEINGYADSKGSKEYNLQLSKARSIACKSYLIKHGVKNVKIKVNALGATPLGLKDEAESERAKNRRVDILIKKSGYASLG